MQARCKQEQILEPYQAECVLSEHWFVIPTVMGIMQMMIWRALLNTAKLFPLRM
jgi:hypothetical protein